MSAREDEDLDLYYEAMASRREARRGSRCQCGDDLPGHCPGPRNCPYSDYAVETAEEPEEQ